MRFFVLLCVFIGGLGQGVVNPKLPELLTNPKSLAIDSGISASLMYLAIFMASFLYGKMADRGGVFKLLRFGLLAYAAVAYLFSVAHSKELVFLLRFLEGLSLSAIFVAADVVLCRASADSERGQWLSFYGIALSLGLLFGPAILLVFEALKISPSLYWSLCWVAAMALLFAIASLRYRLAPAAAPLAAPRSLNRYATVSASLYGFLEAGLVAVLAAMVIRGFHAKIETIFIVTILSAAAASAIWGILIDRMGGRKTLMLVHLVLAFGLGAILFIDLFHPRESLIYASATILGIVAGGVYPSAFSWLVEEVAPSQYGYASGHFTRAYGLGSLLGPLAFGFALEQFGNSGFFGLAALLGLVGFVVTKIYRKGMIHEG